MRGKKIKSNFLKKCNLFIFFPLCLISFGSALISLKPPKPLDPACIWSHIPSPGSVPAKNREAGLAVRASRDTLATVRVRDDQPLD